MLQKSFFILNIQLSDLQGVKYERFFCGIFKVMENVILIGFMGAGKTTIGKKLARLLDYEFIDTDHRIEELTGMTIGELFTLKGEGHFREIERDLLLSLSEYTSPYVLSTGGGMPCYHDNIQLLRALGTTFYLHRSPGELSHRLKNAKKERPLLVGLSESELTDYIETKLADREEYYRMSEFTLDRDQQDPKVIRDLLRILHPRSIQKS